jgi:hypothetical protein
MQMLLARSKCKYWEKLGHAEYGRRTRDMELEVCFEETNTHLLVNSDRAYIQSDGYNCGPIACLKVMEIYGFLKVGFINVFGVSVEGYQPDVLDYFNCCVMKYDINLMAEQQKNILKKINCKDCTEDDIDEKMAALFLATAMVNNPPPMFDSGINFTANDIDEKMAASFVAMDNNHPPVSDSNPKNEQLPLDHEEGAEECSDNNGLNLAKDCTHSCFLMTKKKCDHKISNVQITIAGTMSSFHQSGTTNDTSKIVVT